jgi:hypothetical protein
VTGVTNITTVPGNGFLCNNFQDAGGSANAFAMSSILTNPSVSTCLPVGTYGILVSTPVRALLPFEVSVTCAPCTPVGDEAQAWGGIKSLYR